MTILFFYRILSTWCWLNTKVFIGFSIRSACTQTFHGIRRVNFTGTSKLLYANKAWRRSINFFWYQEGFLNTNTQNFIWYSTNYVTALMHLLISALTFTFYMSTFLYFSVITFTATIRVLVIETQSFVMLICIW